jgi:GR25 family glycosyltransferase involved in LPS biosynthesis
MNSQPAASRFWELVDGVLVINLDHRTDRWEQAQRELAGWVPPDKLHRLPAVLGRELPGYLSPQWFRTNSRAATWAGRAGCLLSHRNALRLARERHWRWTLILEDDVRLHSATIAAVADPLADFLVTEHTHLGVVYLGHQEVRHPVRHLAGLTDSHQLYGISGCLTTHAYLIHTETISRLLARWPGEDAEVWRWLRRHRAIDTWYRNHLARITPVAAVSPAVIRQDESLSDITQRAGQARSAEDLELLCDKAVSPHVWQARRAMQRMLVPLAALPQVVKSAFRKL